MLAFRRSFHALVLTIGLLCLGCGPIGPFSGGRLGGEEGSWPSDWRAAADVEQVQLETGPDDPYSVNVWLVVVDGDAYVASSLLAGAEDPEERQWVRNVESDPRVRVRIGGIVHPARLERVDDVELRARVFAAFLEKYPNLDPSRGKGARYFRIARRAATSAASG